MLGALRGASGVVRGRLGVLAVCGAAVGVAYFGLSLGVGSMSGGLHVNAAATALAEARGATTLTNRFSSIRLS